MSEEPHFVECMYSQLSLGLPSFSEKTQDQKWNLGYNKEEQKLKTLF